MKKCAKCNKIKDISEFNKSGRYDKTYKKYNQIRYNSRCKECTKQYVREYYGRDGIINDKVLIRRKARNYREKSSRDYDPLNKIRHNLRTRLNIAIKRNYKAGSAIRDLGCSIDKFKLWIEMLWQDGMNWDNYGVNGWHLDHIKPLSKFNLLDRDEFIKACHYSNIKPLWRDDNLKKSNKAIMG